MSVYTKVGTGLWTWEPFRRLERSHDDVIGRCAKLFWLALYTVPESKRLVPGLITGSITTMAEAARIPVDDGRIYLDRLLEEDLVEYDTKHLVLRMTMLPDCGESPTNGNAVRGWWRKFQTVSPCRIRDAHVDVLWWIMTEWSRVHGKPISKDHSEAWSETFGRISVPSRRPRKPRHVQTELFSADLNETNDIETNDRSTLVERMITDPDRDHDLRSPDPDEGGSGGGHAAGKVHLTVVPRVGVDDLVVMLSQATGGKFPLALTPDARLALGRAITAAGAIVQGESAFVALREYIERGMPGFPREILTPEQRTKGEISPDAVAAPGWLPLAVQRALTWKTETDAKIAELARLRADAGV